jgi:flagellar hook protein FlgE
MLCDFVVCKFGEGKSELLGQLASKRFSSDNNLRGKKRSVFRAGAFLGDRPSAVQVRWLAFS